MAAATVTDLVVTSPLMRGKRVEETQRRLQAHGFPPGMIDGFYGVATASAVRRFQKARKIKVTGVVDARTTLELTKAPAARKPTVGAAASPGVRALVEARRHIGVKEKPKGSNRQQFGEWFGLDGVPWCAIFVSYCFTVGAGVTLGKGHKGPGVWAKGMAYVPSVEAWLKADGSWIGRATPQPGDIAILNWDGGVPDHIGIVDEVNPDGSFTCVEGNTAVGDDSNGGAVMRRTRYIHQVNGFGRLQ